MKKEFSVALCDNEKSDLEASEIMINEWLEGEGHSGGELFSFGDLPRFRDAITSGGHFDIYIIGISTHGAGSLDIARTIRAREPDSPIIFLTRSKNYAYDAYSINVLRYILKPAGSGEMFSALDLAYLVHRASPKNMITVRLTGAVTNVSADDVVYIENNIRDMRYVLTDGSVLCGTRRNISFEKFFEPLLAEGGFVQPHKSFIINLRHVKELRSANILLTNGTQIPISRRHITEVHDAYKKFNAK